MQRWRLALPERTVAAVFYAVGSAIDQRLANLILAAARRRWPLLKLIPAAWMRPLVAPAAARMRQALARAAVVLAVTIVVTVMVFTDTP